jgi:hypothetical protein
MNFNFMLSGDILNYIKFDKTKMYVIEIAGKAPLSAIVPILYES